MGQASDILFPAPRDSMFDPAAPCLRLRSGAPARVRLWNGDRPWLVSRHADVRAVLSDPRFSADMQRPGFPVLVEGSAETMMDGVFVRMDDPEHARYRRMLTGEFTVRRMRELQPAITRIVDGFLDELAAAGPPADLVATVALPVPSLVICRLLGVPYADHDFFQDRSRVIASQDSEPAQVQAAFADLRTYLGGLVPVKEREPGDDLISRLVAEQEGTGHLTRAELVTMCLLLLMAGHETTAHMIGLGTLALLEHPDQFARLVAEPELVEPAVEELLRYLTVVQTGITRVAVADARVGGQLIRAGDGVIAMLPNANRDHAVFADPDRLDLARSARAHVAFGYGVHQCVGQSLARVELRTTLSRLVARFPTLRLAVPAGQVRLRPNGFIHGVERLPVAW